YAFTEQVAEYLPDLLFGVVPRITIGLEVDGQRIQLVLRYLELLDASYVPQRVRYPVRRQLGTVTANYGVDEAPFESGDQRYAVNDFHGCQVPGIEANDRRSAQIKIGHEHPVPAFTKVVRDQFRQDGIARHDI